MRRILIQHGRVVDPATRRDGRFDVLIEDGAIAAIEPSIPKHGAQAIDASGKLVAPGFVDLHTHLRQPGREDKETIATGTQAAARGGFTAVCAMPNTEPALDERGMVDFVYQEARRSGVVAVHPVGAVTKGRRGKELTDFGELFEAGCIGLSDDGSPVADAWVMRRALEYARVFDRPVIQHAEDPALAGGGVMHEGLVSTTLGLRGMPGQAESVVIARDVALAQLTGGWVHFAHLSCAASVEAIRQAKRRGIRATCEVTPHHLALTDEAAGGFDVRAKVNPPLRTEEDRQALVQGLRDGTIDCIATDHAPHTEWEKDQDFDSAPFGISGLETALGVCTQTLIAPGLLTWPQLIEKLSVVPAGLARIPGGSLAKGQAANLVILDPEATWVVDPARFASKGKHTPFAGHSLQGIVTHTLVNGALVWGT